LKVPLGRYDVKITVGDAERKVGYSILVNDTPLFENIVLAKN
jgi:hypothetical protein